LESTLKNLRKNCESKQADHKKNMNEKQEIPEVQLNGTSIRSGASPKTRRGKGERASAADEAEGLRGMVQNL